MSVQPHSPCAPVRPRPAVGAQEQARRQFLRFLAALASVAWLVAGQGAEGWQRGVGCQWRALTVPPPGSPGFTSLDPALTGVTFSNRLTTALMNRFSNIMNGSGVALGDVDGDGRCDLFFCGLETTNRLYRNLGDWQFEDITAGSGVALPEAWCRGAVLADLDGDRDLDLLITTFQGGLRGLLNDGRGRFVDITVSSGLAGRTTGTSLALADLEGDGDLDLYVANFGDISVLRDGGPFGVRMIQGKPVISGRHGARLKIVDGRLFELGEADALYVNDGQGRFALEPWERGRFRDEEGRPMKAPLDFGLSVQFRDLNGDGAPDLYVCNDFQTPDRLWLNDAQGGFQLIPRLSLRTTSYASMGVDVADFDRDGYFDLFVVEMLSREHPRRMWQMVPNNPLPPTPGRVDDCWQVARNTLLWNRGDGSYAEIAQFAGVAASEWSWMPLALDVDLDGFEDLLIPNGHVHDMNDLDLADWFRAQTRLQPSIRKDIVHFPALETANVAFRNRGDLTFEECGRSWGFDSTRFSHGTATADLDDDGDLDVAINCLHAPALILRNNASAPRLAVRLRGLPPNPHGIGALVTLRQDTLPLQKQEVLAGGRYLSSDDALRVFAATAPGTPVTIEVQWRSGRRSVIHDARANRLYEIEEPGPATVVPPPPAQPTPRPWFQDVSALLNHRHEESLFDDLLLQPLLPRRLAQAGPGVAWIDLDQDGDDDLVVGAGRGGSLASFRNEGRGHFEPWGSGWRWPVLPDDGLGLAAWVGTPGHRSLLLAIARYETNHPAHPSVLECSLPPTPSAPLRVLSGVNLPASPGPLAVADVDGDGDLDVFVGSRVAAGRYPEAPASMLFRNQDGGLAVDPASAELLRHAGLVQGAVFADLEGDGFPELVLACEWGPLRILGNRGGRFRESTSALGLAEATGWWRSVTAADVDGDGRLDLIAGNWGENSPYQPSPAHPIQIVFGDLTGDGSVSLVETYRDQALGQWVPYRNLVELGGALPEIRGRFDSHKAYGRASLDQILGPAGGRVERWQAATLQSRVLLNRGDRFEAIPLPREAQWSPCFGLGAADFDGDGYLDLFLAQNFFALPTDAWRQDAGRGLLLRGDGRGGFTAVPSLASGFAIHGEQRGCAVGDFDADGRPDLVVGQNGQPTRLLRNLGAQPGLRVRLVGPPGNPDGIGAVARLRFGATIGPASEIHAGSGYLSQDSLTLVLATPHTPTQLHIRWPGGRESLTELKSPAREIRVDVSGRVLPPPAP